jgi:hypothetical protein
VPPVGVLLMQHTKRSAGASQVSTETIIVQFDEIRAQMEGFVEEASQHSRAAVAFDQKAPDFSELHVLQVRFLSCRIVLCYSNMLIAVFLCNVIVSTDLCV